jgi:hypothetical protein
MPASEKWEGATQVGQPVAEQPGSAIEGLVTVEDDENE